MCVGADDRGRPPVEQPRERDLLARRLGVEVDDDERRLLPRAVDEVLGDEEWMHLRVHEEPTLEVDDRDRRAIGGGPHRRAATRSSDAAEVGGSQYTVGRLE